MALEFVSLIPQPGSADLTCDVNFGLLGRSLHSPATSAELMYSSSHSADIYGPVLQASFLNAMNINARAERLIQANPELVCGGDEVHMLMQQESTLRSGVDKIVKEMGKRFKAMCVTSKDLPHPPSF